MPNVSQVYALCLLSLAISWPVGASVDVNTVTKGTICGRRPIAAPGTITNGQSSWPGQFPWHAALYRTESWLTISYACGGFIVGEWAVITAAHCVTAPSGYQLAAEELTVRVGLYDLLTLARHSQEHRVRNVLRHGNYTVGSPRHDLALLTLRTIIEFGSFVQPICLPGETSRALQELPIGTVSGWGLTEGDVPAWTLRYSRMPIVGYLQCLESDRLLFGPVLYDGLFCAGWENGTNVCNGDSGGAFVANVNGSWTAYGIVSFTGLRDDTDVLPFRCNTKSLAGFISLPKYIEWIESVALSEGVTLPRGDVNDETPRVTTSVRLSERICQWNRQRCNGEELSYLASVVHPAIGKDPLDPRTRPVVIDCFAVLISNRFLLAPASCHRNAAPAKQFIILEVAGQAMDCRIETFHQHPNFVNNNRPTDDDDDDDDGSGGHPRDQGNLALIGLERKVSLSTCQFVCLWAGSGDDDVDAAPLPDIFLYSAVNVSAGDKSIESQEVTVRARASYRTVPANRCYDELLAPMVMMQEVGGIRLVGIVLQRSCTKIRFIKVAPFLGWIERIVWQS